jgi:hypothetical protein
MRFSIYCRVIMVTGCVLQGFIHFPTGVLLAVAVFKCWLYSGGCSRSRQSTLGSIALSPAVPILLMTSDNELEWDSGRAPIIHQRFKSFVDNLN